MNSVQESKQELEAAIRYAENAISSAKQTIESMVFRQEMAKKQSSEKTGREEALENHLDDMRASAFEDAKTIERLKEQNAELRTAIEEQRTNMALMTDELEEREMLEKNVKYLRDENERLKRENEASSGPCGCQAYRDLEEKVGDLQFEVNALEQPERATMPVIPKAVAIAIFREGMQHGVEAACTELEGQTINIDESEYVGDFHISFERYIELDDHLDLDWMRGKVGDYSEEFVTGALSNLCADKEFECRIHGVDDQEEKKND